MKQAIAFGAVFVGGVAIGVVSARFMHAESPPYVTKQILQRI